MIIEIPRLSPDGEEFEGEELPEMLGLERDPLVRPEGPVRYHLSAQVTGQELLVQGRLSLPATVRCSRCAEFFSTTIEDSSFLRAYELSGGVETVDVTGDIREDILLEIPLFSVCSTGCKGLCARCGRNLNEGPCGCRETPPGGAWSTLDQLKLT